MTENESSHLLAFGDNCVNINKDNRQRQHVRLLWFLQCKVYADILGVLRREGVRRQWEFINPTTRVKTGAACTLAQVNFIRYVCSKYAHLTSAGFGNYGDVYSMRPTTKYTATNAMLSVRQFELFVRLVGGLISDGFATEADISQLLLYGDG